MPSPAIDGRRAVENLNAVAGWKELIHRLLDNRDGAATRTLSEAARAAFRHWQAVWKDRAAHRSETASTSAALIKADIHLARIALVLDEADPERPEQVEQDHIDRAAQIVNFTLDCWRALPEQDSMSLTLRDKVLDRGIVRLVGWLRSTAGRRADASCRWRASPGRGQQLIWTPCWTATRLSTPAPEAP